MGRSGRGRKASGCHGVAPWWGAHGGWPGRRGGVAEAPAARGGGRFTRAKSICRGPHAGRRVAGPRSPSRRPTPGPSGRPGCAFLAPPSPLRHLQTQPRQIPQPLHDGGRVALAEGSRTRRRRGLFHVDGAYWPVRCPICCLCSRQPVPPTPGAGKEGRQRPVAGEAPGPPLPPPSPEQRLEGDTPQVSLPVPTPEKPLRGLWRLRRHKRRSEVTRRKLSKLSTNNLTWTENRVPGRSSPPTAGDAGGGPRHSRPR